MVLHFNSTLINALHYNYDHHAALQYGYGHCNATNISTMQCKAIPLCSLHCYITINDYLHCNIILITKMQYNFDRRTALSYSSYQFTEISNIRQKGFCPPSGLSLSCPRDPPHPPVMSMNIWIFHYLGEKPAIKYYSNLYLCHFPSLNIFWYSLVDFWTTEYIWKFVCKFLQKQIFSNIYFQPYYNICLSMFNKQW